ncbi:MAG: Fe-S cluster assembly protein SufD [Bacteroidales bacterium]|jgi:Fe-S cluster assembly protein SufD|nr:Fe-S cluster assembly protein SufD [Bacteroidales bacterium]
MGTNLSNVNQYFSQIIAQNLQNAEKKDTPQMQKKRNFAAQLFEKEGVPHRNDERWRNFNWNDIVDNSYHLTFEPKSHQSPDNFFTCSAHGLDTYKFIFHNGWAIYKDSPLMILPNGVVIGSLKSALKETHYQSIIDKNISQYADFEHVGLYNLNRSLWQDGLFVYIPDNTALERAIQLVNVLQTTENLFINTLHTIILGKKSHLKLVHCIDTIENKKIFLNGVMEIVLSEGASLDYLKMENADKQSVLTSQTLVYQHADSLLKTHVNSLNGGRVHNTLTVHLDGKNAKAHCNGLYLLDKQQHVSHAVSIYHHVSDCQSTQNYHGILDEQAKAEFTSRVYVAKDAQRTQSEQLNRNILLTDTASVNSRPFLEIYADDVKCNHGATVGQMDEEAIFYLKSRGICEKNAKKLLLHAFAKEIVDKIAIPSLVEYCDEFVQKRLSGEPTRCTNCTVACEKPIDFHLKMPEI